MDVILTWVMWGMMNASGILVLLIGVAHSKLEDRLKAHVFESSTKNADLRPRVNHTQL